MTYARTFTVAGFSCMLFEVGRFSTNADVLFPDAPPDELERALARHGFVPEEIVFPIHSLLVDTGAHLALIDPGAGEDPGRLLFELRRLGVDSRRIDGVIITHGHSDHYRGGVTEDGAPVFPNAFYALQRAEWEYWTAGDDPDQGHVKAFRGLLPPIRSRVILLDGKAEILPGIEAVPASGHSPGHMVVRVAGRAVYTGDVLLTPISVEHPDWTARFDRWPEEVVATRRMLLQTMAAEDALVIPSHFPPPGFGRVRALNGGRRCGWETPLR
jgi:glyoxylase-like metal-dependent hydrolase (beta-lactamase superfamily II)